MVSDPYRTLGVSHEASQTQIKLAYRRLALQCHPDRLTRRKASPEQFKDATDRFAEIASAYQLLSDPQRKKEYDHVYKFGGYDDATTSTCSMPQPKQSKNESTYPNHEESLRSERREKNGIGYTVFDPISFICSRGRSQSAAVAGIQIPSRMHLSRPPPGGGVRFAFSLGQYSTSSSGATRHVSKTTQFVEGKKFSRVETTTIHPDGRKEIVIEGNDYIERRYSKAPPKKKAQSSPNVRRCSTGEDVTQTEENSLPWYVNAWHGIREKVTMCHNPCGMTLAH